MKRQRITTLVLAAVLTASVTLAGSARAHASVLQNIGTGKCLQPVAGTFDEGAAIVQQPCNGSTAQQWALVSLGGTTYRIKSLLSGYCLETRLGATNGSPIDQWQCNWISNEIWDTGYTPYPLPAVVALTSRVSGTTSHCLDVPGNLPYDGLAMQLYRCNGTVAQRWRLR
jgi:hypothetical protein